MPDFLKLTLANGNFIAYHKTDGKKKSLPGVIFCGGFRSDMTGTKAIALEEYARENDLDFIRFDYLGHGESSGNFAEGSIGLWKENVLSVLDNLTDRPQIIAGSSMGGWLMLLAALERKEKIAGLLGLASAPDFVEYLIWQQLPKDQQKEVMEKGLIHIPSDECGTYPITKKLIEDGRHHLLLHDRIDINVPIRLIHGMKDEDVPYETSVRIANLVTAENVRVILHKPGSHRLSEKEDLELITKTLGELLESF